MHRGIAATAIAATRLPIAENQALLAFARQLTHSPANVLQALVDIALELCRGALVRH